MTIGIDCHLDDCGEQLYDLQSRLKDPRRFIVNWKITVDEFKERMVLAWKSKKQNRHHHLKQIELRLAHQNPVLTTRDRKNLIQNRQKDLHNHFMARLTATKERLLKNAAVLESISPLAVLQRGYSITRHLDNGEIIRQTDGLNEGDHVNVLLAKGNFNARISKVF